MEHYLILTYKLFSISVDQSGQRQQPFRIQARVFGADLETNLSNNSFAWMVFEWICRI